MTNCEPPILWDNTGYMTNTLIGSQVAGYRVERLLGRGGMASVYFAWDTKNDRAVALKVMDERYRETPSYVERFIHEAQTMIGWNHPHIVRVYDAGEENQVYYYAMEFIRGLDLAQLLRQYQDAGQLMPYSDVVRVGWAIAEALDYAHSHGILHRDVKPSNVLVSVDGRILLSDFGLVMDVSRGTLGETFGSPAYIAPEQARSSARAVPQSDLYSLGVMLYEMLVGATPFHDPSPTALAIKHMTEEPPRPRALNPRLNPSVEAVLLRALRKTPAERYASGREMLSALERALGDALHSEDATAPHPMPNETQALRTQRAHPPAVPAKPPQDLPVLPPEPPHQHPQPQTQRPAYGATAVQPAAPPPAYGYRQPAPPGQPPAGPPPYSGGASGSYGAPPMPPTAPRRARGFGWGCLAALLAAGALVIALGVVFAANRPALAIFPWLARPTDTPPAPSVTPLAPPTLTVTPTFTASPEPTATETPTATPTDTPTPEPTATPEPTDTPVPPTNTPTATAEPVYQLLLASSNDNGFVLANIGAEPFPLELIELREEDDDRPRLRGSDWELEFLEPEQCVIAWLGGRPRVPSEVDCELVGEALRFERNERFWMEPVDVYVGGARVETCVVRDNICEFHTRPEED